MDPAQLMSSSQRWMAQGLAAFSRNDGSADFAVHHVGVAMEHLLKAYLASLHPAHIVDEKNWESLLHATGHADRTRTPRSRTKTIGLSVAFDRVRRLVPKVTVTVNDFEPVRAARDGVAHAGYHDEAEVRAVLTTAVRVAIPVLAEIEQLPGFDDRVQTYWGSYSQLRDDLVNEHTTELRLAVTAKITRAKHTFLERLGWASDQQRAAMVGAISAQIPHAHDLGQLERADSCPACEGRGWFSGSAMFELRSDGDGNAEATVMFYPEHYDCTVCGLSLDSSELELLELTAPIELIHEDPYDWIEPDEDVERDR
ncbi:hypothetical protein [Saccharothrix lopnurensis]|uniref:Uncharacterized protein n=1 Tax=Saccharothrix lopnurensis TaxID=1670621 RepID=A0ABW1NXP4_9PSEU